MMYTCKWSFFLKNGGVVGKCVLRTAKDILVKIRSFFIPVDFVILDMEIDTKIPLILRRPLLSMTTAYIDAGVGVIQLNINGQKTASDRKMSNARRSKVSTRRNP